MKLFKKRHNFPLKTQTEQRQIPNILDRFGSYQPGQNDRRLYRVIREAIPLVDKAISRLCQLNGTIQLKANNSKIEQKINDFAENIPIEAFHKDSPNTQKGLNEYLYQIADMALEQGFAIGEIVSNKAQNEILSLQVPDSLSFEFRDKDMLGLQLFQNQKYGPREIKKSPFIKLFSFDTRGTNFYSMLWNLEFVSRIVLRMWASTEQVWWRYGDPSLFVQVKEGKNSSNENGLFQVVKNTIDSIFKNRQNGYASDGFVTVDEDSQIIIKILGESEGSKVTLNFKEEFRVFAEQISVKTGLPGWMLNQNWSTTERLSFNQLQIVLNDVWGRQEKLEQIAIDLIQLWLDLNGFANQVYGVDWWTEWEATTMNDLMNDANVNNINEKTKSIFIQNINNLVRYEYLNKSEAKKILQEKRII